MMLALNGPRCQGEGESLTVTTAPQSELGQPKNQIRTKGSELGQHPKMCIRKSPDLGEGRGLTRLRNKQDRAACRERGGDPVSHNNLKPHNWFPEETYFYANPATRLGTQMG